MKQGHFDAWHRALQAIKWEGKTADRFAAYALDNASDVVWDSALDHWIGRDFYGWRIEGTDADAQLICAVATAKMYADGSLDDPEA